jgi:penicillin-binding protein 2
MSKFFRKRNRDKDFDYENIFLDSKNVSKMDEGRFEGFIEQSIPKRVIYTVPIVFLIILLFFAVQIFNLQIVYGEKFYSQSENNRLNNSLIFNQRGVIYDRNGVELAWNIEKDESEDFALRRYIEGDGFSHLLGFVSYPLRDSSGNFYKTSYEGKAGIEKSYDDFLNGEPGVKIVEVNALGEKISESSIRPGSDGENITLTIDSRIQTKASQLLKEYIDDKGFTGGVGLIMDVTNGNIITMVSVPEYDSNILSDGKDTEKINEFTSNENNAFLNRTILGNFTPGSIVKPFVALGALEEGLITPERVIFTDGVLELPNPFLPGQFTFFRDWKNHGPVNMYQAIANSSNIYFYNLGGGFNDVQGLGITKMVKWFDKFGFGQREF